jgi:hypothetical protein
MAAHNGGRNRWRGSDTSLAYSFHFGILWFFWHIKTYIKLKEKNPPNWKQSKMNKSIKLWYSHITEGTPSSDFIIQHVDRVWWHMSIVPGTWNYTWRPREDCWAQKFKTSLGSKVRPPSQKQTNNFECTSLVEEATRLKRALKKLKSYSVVLLLLQFCLLFWIHLNIPLELCQCLRNQAFSPR